MSYIVMAVGEDGMEFRAVDQDFLSEEDAYNALPEARENYPESRLHVELLKDKAYYMDQRLARENDDECYYDCDGEPIY